MHTLGEEEDSASLCVCVGVPEAEREKPSLTDECDDVLAAAGRCVSLSCVPAGSLNTRSDGHKESVGAVPFARVDCQKASADSRAARACGSLSVAALSVGPMLRALAHFLRASPNAILRRCRWQARKQAQGREARRPVRPGRSPGLENQGRRCRCCWEPRARRSLAAAAAAPLPPDQLTPCPFFPRTPHRPSTLAHPLQAQ